jgi:glucan phosphoethanolaminetransferase (alkaline phosphatase superfamily)
MGHSSNKKQSDESTPFLGDRDEGTLDKYENFKKLAKRILFIIFIAGVVIRSSSILLSRFPCFSFFFFASNAQVVFLFSSGVFVSLNTLRRTNVVESVAVTTSEKSQMKVF